MQVQASGVTEKMRVTAFLDGKKLSKQEVDQLKKLIDDLN